MWSGGRCAGCRVSAKRDRVGGGSSKGCFGGWPSIRRGSSRLTNIAAKRVSGDGTSLLGPLREPTFRNLLTANFVSDIGAFMQAVGAAWLMVSLHSGPAYVALTQTASSLPYFLLALPAGSAGDILDRRKLILATETWMTCVALLICVLTIGKL